MDGRIIMTIYNDELEDGADYRNEAPLLPHVGVHAVCGGEIALVDTSPTHTALICDCCGLRVPIPRGIDNYGQLREYFQSVLPDVYDSPGPPPDITVRGEAEGED